MLVIMLSRVLAVATALLTALVIHQYNTINQLRADAADTQARLVADARATAAGSMEGQGAEIQRALNWLDAFYKDRQGLDRSQGLWINSHPDFEGIGYWIFDVYLRRRLKGDSEQDARAAVETAIRRSDEWRAKHPQGR